MKKRILYLLMTFCLVFFGCGNSDEENSKTEISAAEEIFEEEDLTKEELQEEQGLMEDADELSMEEYLQGLSLEDYIKENKLLESPIREYGEEAGYIQLEDDMVVRIVYPEGEIIALNNAIEEWVNEIVTYYQEESVGSSKDGDAAELTAEYDSYVVNDEIVSVKMTGFYDRPYLAHPVDIIATFHANIQTGELITLEDVLLTDGSRILQEKVVMDASISEENVDEEILSLWTLKNEGLEIILERGDYLPMSEGTVTLLYSYDEIKDIFAFQKDLNIENIEENPEDHIVLSEKTIENPAVSEVDGQSPMIALTFDDGPSKHTARLLDIFAAHGGKGTFFVVGNVLDSRKEELQRIVGEGHEIAGHSWNHRQLSKLGVEELTDQLMSTRAKIYEITGKDTTLLRPPYGSYNDQVKAVCQNLGIYMANWSVDTLDWKYKDANRIYNLIMDEVKDGDIILCHDLHGTTVDAMERVIPDLIEKGYQLVTVTELLSQSGKEISAGNVYNKGVSRTTN